MNSKFKLLTVAIAIATLSSVGVANASAKASPTLSIRPFSAQGCSNNVCIYLSTPSSGTVYVQGWAYNTNFVGHFVVSAPSETDTSGTQTWLGLKGNYYQVNGISAVVGTYCVTGYSSAGINEGEACESVL